MNRRTVIKALAAAPILLSGFSKKGFTAEDRKKRWAERLDLVNPLSAQRFEMLLKGNTTIGSVLNLDSAGNSRVEYMVKCRHTAEAVALTDILVEGSPDVRISVTVDGEYILKDVDPATASASEIKPMDLIRTDIFRAETPEKAQAGIFMPNGTQVCVYASESGPIPDRVRLETALYMLKDPRQSRGR